MKSKVEFDDKRTYGFMKWIDVPIGDFFMYRDSLYKKMSNEKCRSSSCVYICGKYRFAKFSGVEPVEVVGVKITITNKIEDN